MDNYDVKDQMGDYKQIIYSVYFYTCPFHFFLGVRRLSIKVEEG